MAGAESGSTAGSAGRGLTGETAQGALPQSWITAKMMDAALNAARDRWLTGSSDTTQMLLSAEAALKAIEPMIAELLKDQREEIAKALEGEWEKIWLSKEEPPYWAAYERAVYRTLKSAAEIARGESAK